MGTLHHDALLVFLDAVVRALEDVLAAYRRPPTPGPLSVKIAREQDMALIYEVTLPPPGAADVTIRELTVTVAGGAPAVSDLGPEEAPPEIAAEPGQDVELSLCDVDDAGNRSEVSVLSFTASDTLPPPAPGQLGVTVVREE